MKRNSSMNRKFNQGILVIMGFVWIALALFGLIFDPEKKVIIISQFIAGLLCFIFFIVLKLKKQTLKK